MKLFEDKTQIRLTNSLIAIFSLISAIYITMAYLRTQDYGWHLNDSINTIVFLLATTIWLFRNKIPLNVKAHTIVSLLIVSGLLESFFTNTYKGYLILIFALVIATYSIATKQVYIYLIGTLVISFAITILGHNHFFGQTPSTLIQNSENKWFEEIILFTVVTITLIGSLILFRKRIDNILAESEKETIKYQPLFEQSYSFIYVLDYNGNVIEANQAALFYINKKLTDVKGSYFPNTLWWNHSEIAQQKIEKALEACKNGDFKRFETNHKNFDGALEYFDYTLKPIFDDDLTIKYIIAEGRDITRIKRTEQALIEGEERLIALSESTYEGLIITDNGFLVEANTAVFKLFKLESRKDVFGANIFETFVHPEDRHIIYEKLKNPSNSPYEVRGIQADGTIIELEIQGREIIYKGKTHRISAIRDLTERKKAQKALIDSEEKYRLITENINDIICKFDENLNVTFVSSSVYNILGYTVDEIYSISIKELTTPESYQIIVNNLLTKKGYIHTDNEHAWRSSSFELQMRHKNGSILWAHISAKLIKTGNDSFEILIGARNIDELKQIQFTLEQSKNQLKRQNEEYERLNRELNMLNQELIVAKNKAEESDKLKGAFLANMSHEIRTPLNSIIGFSKMYQRDDLDEEKRKRYSSFVINNGLQLLSIVNDILDLSKIESAQIRIKKEEVNINLLMDSIYLNFQENNNKGLYCSMQKGLPENSKIMTDGNRLQQILLNLTNNAYKFTKKGNVSFGYNMVNNNLVFYVEDTGIGISSDNQEKIFERFRQVEMETSRVFGGAGLGLSISKKLVEIMGGKIWVKSKSGVGSTFYFSIPYQTSPSNENEPKNIHTLSSKRYATIENTILVAEDDESNFIYLNELLMEAEYHIVWVKNGADAVDKCLSDNKISLVLMDIKMPLMDGLEATRRIKKERPNLPIIAQTAFAMADDREIALKSGCDDYLSKPIDPKNLMSKIKQYI